jgi:Beta-propeller repeat
MKLRGAWGMAVKFMGVVTLFCCVVLWSVIAGAGKRSLTGKAGSVTAQPPQATKPVATKENSGWAKAYGRLPMSFEENQGQTAREVRYVAHGGRYELFLTPQEAVMALRPTTHLDFSPRHRSAYLRALREQRRAAQTTTAIRMRLEGANPEPQISGAERLPTRVNYFTGSDPKNWHTEIPAYARVKYAGIYPGVDLVFYGNQRRLEYDFVVAPGADPKAIRLKIDGAQKMRINSHGDLVLSVAEGEVELQKPLIYQQLNGERREIAGNYVIAKGHRVTFSVAKYDRREPLILDPVLDYSTYLGGSGAENTSLPVGIAVDSAGDAFVVGDTFSTDFPTTANGLKQQPLTGNLGASFVAELNPAGTQLLYSTYLTGTATNPGDGATSVAVDSTGKVYVTGVTFDAGFPSKNPLPYSADTTNGTCFVTKLDPTQSGNTSLIFSTYLGGTVGLGSFANGIAVDGNGNAYVVGETSATDFPTTSNAYQIAFNPLDVNNASGSAFLSRIDTTTSTLVYSTYLSGNAAHGAGVPVTGDIAYGVAVDTSNNAYVVGGTTSNNSTGFPSSTNANEPAPPVGNTKGSAFVSKINTAGSGNTSLVYSTYIAGSAQEIGYGIALGPNNVPYVTGSANSSDFPFTAGAFDTSAVGTGKAFVVLVDTTNTVLGNPLTPFRYATFLGGGAGDVGYGIRADASGNAYVVGTTSSPNFPGTNTGTKLGGFQTTLTNSNGSPFIAKLLPTIGGSGANDLVYSTYFGGSGNGGAADQGFGIAIDTMNPPHAYITGQTTSANMPVLPKPPANPSAFQPALNGTSSDAFVAKLPLIPTLAVVPFPAPGATIDFGTVQIGMTSAAKTVTLTNNTTANIAYSSAVLGGANSADFAVSTMGCNPNIIVGTPCVVSITFAPTAPAASEVATLTITDGDSTSPQVFNLTGKGSATAPPPDFTLSAAPTALTVAQGAVGTAVTITVNPTNGFASAVALTCTGAPANSTCVLNPTSITPPTTSALTFTAHAMLVPLPIPKPAPPLNYLRIVPLFLALMLLFLLRSTQRLRTRLATVSAIAICVTLAACSGPGSGSKNTAKGVYPLTVKGTSGALSHNTTVTITVN